jgi:hypothetical protein
VRHLVRLFKFGCIAMNYILDFGRITEDEKEKVNDIILNYLTPTKQPVVEEVDDPTVSYPEVLINHDNSHYIQNLFYIESTNWLMRNRRNNQPNSNLIDGNLSDIILIENSSQFIGPRQFQNENDEMENQNEVDLYFNQFFDQYDNYIGPIRNNIIYTVEEINNQNSNINDSIVGDSILVNNSIDSNSSIVNNSFVENCSMVVNNIIDDNSSLMIVNNSIDNNSSLVLTQENNNSKKKLSDRPERKKNPKYF